MITSVQDVHYVVSDMDRAVAFYRDVLGMRVLDSCPQWTSLDCFGARVGLRCGTQSPDALSHAGARLTLRSTDLAEDIAYLKRNGVHIASEHDQPWGRYAVFTDTEGNALELMQVRTS